MKQWFTIVVFFVSAFGVAVESSAPKPTPKTSLRDAYQREFIFLEQQRQQLKQRMGEYRKTSQRDLSEARDELDELNHRLTSVEVGNEMKRKQLRRLEENVASGQEAKSTLSSILSQIDEAMGRAKPVEENALTALNAKVPELREYLAGLRQARFEQKPFYRSNGEKVDGEVLSLGGVAAFGRKGEEFGILVPSGSELLKMGKLVPGLPRAGDENPLELFLLDPAQKEGLEESSSGVIDMIQKGGVVAWVIVGLGVSALLVGLMRILILRSQGRFQPETLREIETLVKKDKVDEARDLARGLSGAYGRVAKIVFTHMDSQPETLESVAMDGVHREALGISKFGPYILVIAATAPLLGLLGTVTGMISTFDIITEFGTGNPKLLSTGISEALITTRLGLTVAIPCLLLGNWLGSWTNRVREGLEELVSGLLASIELSKESVRL